MSTALELPPGLMVIHGNQAESLRELLVGWLQRHPLAPLETETVLVHSNGIAQWLKLALAREVSEGGLGVAANLRLELPAKMLWRAYRGVLGAQQVPEVSLLDKAPLTWRLMRLLPELWMREDFQPLRAFLADDPDWRRRHQLSEKLADLYDQYQVYRSDWLADWAQGLDQLRRASGQVQPLPPGQRWQAQLWCELMAEVGPQAAQASRAQVHRQFIERLSTAQPGTLPGLPRRLSVFGISSLPAQTFEALAAISRHSQVLLCVHNPSRHHWSDIVADKDLLRHAYKRHSRRATPTGLPAAQQAQPHGHPLLAAWGKQGRDYIHMLDQYDDPASYRDRIAQLPNGQIDLFAAPDERHLLGQLQADILDLRTLDESRAHWPKVDPARDHSIRFHVAHSAQREVEILHDQLLARLEADHDLAPRDIIVMLPDIDVYAPHIEAVFGQLAAGDARRIPYSLADRGRRGREPMLVALEYLLQLPQSRLTSSEILDLLEVAAVRRCFGLDDAALVLVQRWIKDAGVRWGLDESHRQRLDLAAAQETNSWRFGLRRMLLGFAVGEGESWQGIEPYAEIGGLEAASLGPLVQLLDRLDESQLELAEPAEPAAWVLRLRALMARFFVPASETETLLLAQLQGLLDQWLADCERAGFAQPLPLSVVRESWLAGIDQRGLQQRFMAGAVSFCTLLPMRAIPFKLVCLLGMNDGDYPRQQSHVDFDLMQGDYRPGDRSRREDDRYLMLEALLSAREQLYVSWVGRSIRDNSERAPSVLVGQLRDHLAAGWQLAVQDQEEGTSGLLATPHAAQGDLLAALTQEHPLQPFSARYFPPGEAGADAAQACDGLYTYAREWRSAVAQAPASVAPDADDSDERPDTQALPPQPLLSPLVQEQALQLRELGDFLADPVKAFFQRRLQARLSDPQGLEVDDELFAVDGLRSWQLHDAVFEKVRPWIDAASAADFPSAAAIDARVQQELAGLQGQGQLPLQAFGTRAAQQLQASSSHALCRYAQLLQACHPGPSQAMSIEHRLESQDLPQLLELQDMLTGLRRGPADDCWIQLQLLPGKLHQGQDYKWYALVRPWLKHLALQLCGDPAYTVLISRTGVLMLAPLELERARRALDDVMTGWSAGMRQPLPVACKTACAWLEAEGASKDKQAWDAAQNIYDGGYNHKGEVQGSPALARAYPTFEQLCADAQGFEHWARTLYQPLLDHVVESNRLPHPLTGALEPAPVVEIQS